MKIFGIVLLCFIMGCSDDENPTAPQGWQGEFNQAGFPDVIGEYALVTKQFNVSCSDGSSGNENAISFNLVVTQDDNEITLTQPSSTPLPPGYEITYATPLSGTVDKEGNLLANQTVKLTIDGVSGEVTVIYYIDGKFKTGGWSGDYEYSLNAPSESAYCEYKTTFSGDKIGTLGKIGNSIIALPIPLFE
jgi:hypothetical protein